MGDAQSIDLETYKQLEAHLARKTCELPQKTRTFQKLQLDFDTVTAGSNALQYNNNNFKKRKVDEENSMLTKKLKAAEKNLNIIHEMNVKLMSKSCEKDTQIAALENTVAFVKKQRDEIKDIFEDLLKASNEKAEELEQVAQMKKKLSAGEKKLEEKDCKIQNLERALDVKEKANMELQKKNISLQNRVKFYEDSVAALHANGMSKKVEEEQDLAEEST